jgi:hypothetical protein
MKSALLSDANCLLSTELARVKSSRASIETGPLPGLDQVLLVRGHARTRHAQALRIKSPDILL